jgi:hypothetical protein
VVRLLAPSAAAGREGESYNPTLRDLANSDLVFSEFQYVSPPWEPPEQSHDVPADRIGCIVEVWQIEELCCLGEGERPRYDYHTASCTLKLRVCLIKLIADRSVS